MTGSPISPGRSGAQAAVVRELGVRRMWVGLLLTVFMFAFYTLYLLLNSYAKPFLARQLVPGLTVAMVVGFLSIVIPCVLAGIYMSWANRRLDTACDQISQGGASEPAK